MNKKKLILKAVRIVIVRVVDDVTRVEDFDFNNILINEKSYEKSLLIQNTEWCQPLIIRFDKVDRVTSSVTVTLRI